MPNKLNCVRDSSVKPAVQRSVTRTCSEEPGPEATPQIMLRHR